MAAKTKSANRRAPIPAGTTGGEVCTSYFVLLYREFFLSPPRTTTAAIHS